MNAGFPNAGLGRRAGAGRSCAATQMEILSARLSSAARSVPAEWLQRMRVIRKRRSLDPEDLSQAADREIEMRSNVEREILTVEKRERLLH